MAERESKRKGGDSSAERKAVDVCEVKTELGWSLNDLKRWLVDKTEPPPHFQVEMGNGKTETVALEEHLKVELLPRHQMVVAYWLAVQPKLQTKALPPSGAVQHRIYYPAMFPGSLSDGAVHYVNDSELDFYSGSPRLEQVMALLWRELGSAYVGKANNLGPSSGEWSGRKKISTIKGLMSDLVQFLKIESKADLLRAEVAAIEEATGIAQLQKEVQKAKKRSKKLASELNEKLKLLRKEHEPQIKPIKAQLKGVAEQIKKELAQFSGECVHECWCLPPPSTARDVIGTVYDNRFCLLTLSTKKPRETVVPISRNRFPHSVLAIYNDLRRRYPDQRDLDTYLLERQNFPNQSELRNALRALNRRTYERRVCNTVV